MNNVRNQAKVIKTPPPAIASPVVKAEPKPSYQKPSYQDSGFNTNKGLGGGFDDFDSEFDINTTGNKAYDSNKSFGKIGKAQKNTSPQLKREKQEVRYRVFGRPFEVIQFKQRNVQSL